MSETNPSLTVEVLTSQLLELHDAYKNLQDTIQAVLQTNGWLAAQLFDLTLASDRLARRADAVIQDNARLATQLRARREQSSHYFRAAEAEGNRLRYLLLESVQKLRRARRAERATVVDRDNFESLWLEERAAKAQIEAERNSLREERDLLLKELEDHNNTAQKLRDEMPKLREAATYQELEDHSNTAWEPLPCEPLPNREED